MATMFVRHQVTDFGKWKQAYDDFDSTRKSLGVTGHAVYRSDADPNNVTVTHDFTTVDAAKQFAGSQELRDAMQQAGVVGDPTIWFTERV